MKIFSKNCFQSLLVSQIPQTKYLFGSSLTSIIVAKLATEIGLPQIAITIIILFL
jgi:hypothetical protein